MKKIRLLILLCVLTTSAVLAQGSTQDRVQPLQSEQHSTSKSFRHANARVIRMDSVIRVSFELSADKDGVRRDEMLTLIPELYNDNHRQTLPCIQLLRQRTEWINYRLMRSHKGRMHLMNTTDSIAYRAVDGGRIDYSVSIPYDSLLDNTLLRLVCTPVMGLRERAVYWVQLTEHPSILQQKNSEPQQRSPSQPSSIFIPNLRPLSDYALPIPVISQAEALSKEYPFVASMAEYVNSKRTHESRLFDPDMSLNMGKGDSQRAQSAVQRFIENNEQGAMQINFECDSTTIRRYYRDNNNALVVLASVLKKIQSSRDSRVEKIVIAGFASPEGALYHNDALAWKRAEAVRDFVLNNSNIKPSNIQLYNGSEDWQGLRKLIAKSEMKYRERLLDIIDNVSDLDDREEQLMDVAAAEPYRYMNQYLFPQLRNAAYIKVYYADMPDATAINTNLHKAVTLMHKGEYVAALELLATQSALPTGEVENMMGVCAIELRDFDRAREFLQTAVNKGCLAAEDNLRSITKK